MATIAPPTGPDCRHLRPGSEFGDGTVGIRAGAHLGVDFQPQVPGGEDWVYAIEDGVVEALFTELPAGSWSNPLYAGHTGNIVAVRAASGAVWTYQHGKDFQVRRGDRVKAGDRLHRMWRSGRATGNHLHLGRRLNGRFVDPEPFLRKNNVWPVRNPFYTGGGFQLAAPITPTTSTPKEDTLSKAEVQEIKQFIRDELTKPRPIDATQTAVYWVNPATGKQERTTLTRLLQTHVGLTHADAQVNGVTLETVQEIAAEVIPEGDPEEDQQHEEVNG